MPETKQPSFTAGFLRKKRPRFASCWVPFKKFQLDPHLLFLTATLSLPTDVLKNANRSLTDASFRARRLKFIYINSIC
jgi:hypothetical protein